MDPYKRDTLDRGADVQWEPVRATLGHTRRFAERMNLASTLPHPELASTTYCLAQPGKEYVVFQPKSAEPFSVELKLGTYRFEWFDTAKGASSEDGQVQASEGKREFKAPFNGSAVLYLKSQ